ncbi:MAG: hydrogenase maturation protease [Actinomycetota bacterium]
MTGVEVELTAEGYVRLGVELARERFPGDAAVALQRSAELWLVPLRGVQGGGLLLKQRNLDGDRAVLVREALPDEIEPGHRLAVWDHDEGALRIPLGGA